MICKSPILFLCLISEFLYKIAPISIEFTNQCKGTAEDCINFAKEIEDTVGEEDTLQFYLM